MHRADMLGQVNLRGLRVVLAVLAAWFGVASVGSALNWGHKDHPDCRHCIAPSVGRKQQNFDGIVVEAHSADGDPPLDDSLSHASPVADLAPAIVVPSGRDLGSLHAPWVVPAPVIRQALHEGCPTRAPPSPC